MMPSSFVDSFAPIVHLLTDLQPRRIVDVGPGWGKYGLACREYLPDLSSLVAIEVPEGRKVVQDAIYDVVYTGDVRVFPNYVFWQRFDLVLLIDVIEHLPQDEGGDLLIRIARAGTTMIVSTPKVFVEQSDPSNPHEDHLCVWEWEDFIALPTLQIVRDVSTIDSIIYVLGPK